MMKKIVNCKCEWADYNQCYDPTACNNGGGYWQPEGTCTIMLDDGTIIHAEYEDSSCGDFGSRWSMVFTCNGEHWTFYEDFVGTSPESQDDNISMNAEMGEGIFQRFDVRASKLIALVASTINKAAREKYYREYEE